MGLADQHALTYAAGEFAFPNTDQKTLVKEF